MTAANQPTVWTLTDGKAGDEQPLIGIAEAMSVEPVLRHVRPRKLFTWFMPWGPVDPREAVGRPGSPLAPPFPDICLATGRRAVAYLRALKAASPTTLTVFFKDPRTSRHGADLLIVQAHDRPRGKNVLTVTTAPNRMSQKRFDEIRKAPPAELNALPSPRIAVLVGGNSRHHHFSETDISHLIDGLQALRRNGASLMVTASRRTPEALKQQLEALGREPSVHFWNGKGDNPLAPYLALADEIVVTADSTNMIGEAASTGQPVQIFYPGGGHPKIDRFLAELSREANLGRFPDSPASGSYPPVNSTPLIAGTILDLWKRDREAAADRTA